LGAIKLGWGGFSLNSWHYRKWRKIEPKSQLITNWKSCELLICAEVEDLEQPVTKKLFVMGATLGLF